MCTHSLPLSHCILTNIPSSHSPHSCNWRVYGYSRYMHTAHARLVPNTVQRESFFFTQNKIMSPLCVLTLPLTHHSRLTQDCFTLGLEVKGLEGAVHASAVRPPLVRKATVQHRILVVVHGLQWRKAIDQHCTYGLATSPTLCIGGGCTVRTHM